MKRTEPVDPLYWAAYFSLQEQSFPARTILLKEGERARNLYIIKSGCLRLWINNNGNEITGQFFKEHSIVASLESLIYQQPSDFYLETIEKSVVYILDQQTFEEARENNAAFKEWMNHHLLDRFIYYSRHLISFLRDKPEERYRKLLEHDPAIVQRIPQHYIASYLGITPVSLSRIRNKIRRESKTANAL